MAQRHQVVSVPGFTFGLLDTQQANYQRLSYGALEAASVEQGVERYVTAVKDWYTSAHC
jgi:aspartate/methionine/tyrosine aminotransferase